MKRYRVNRREGRVVILEPIRPPRRHFILCRDIPAEGLPTTKSYFGKVRAIRDVKRRERLQR